MNKINIANENRHSDAKKNLENVKWKKKKNVITNAFLSKNLQISGEINAAVKIQNFSKNNRNYDVMGAPIEIN